ncbi:MAG TPA: PAS domain S-box protein [Candidatus Saccharimonadales bacterium]|nr:PAS domain S-box protein [Candidatus Saccharimonadales bacterium]
MARRVPLSPEELRQKCEAVANITKGFDFLADHVVLTDTDSNILYANKAAQDKSGFSLAEMVGKNPGDLWGGYMPKEIYEEMYHKIKDLKQPWHGKVKNRSKDGKEYWQELRVNPILDNNNKCIYFVAIEPDIDNTKKESVEEINQSIAEVITLGDFLKGQQIKITDLNNTIEELRTKLAKSEGKKEIINT